MRVVSDSGDFVSIERCDDDGPSHDVLVIVDVRCRGFTGRIDTWILREAWAAFCDRLDMLEHRRLGEASVESISPKELLLTIRSLDRAGHMGIEGFVGYRGTNGETLLTFSWLPFDPSSLPQIARDAREIAR
jgi:hypothetical protein